MAIRVPTLKNKNIVIRLAQDASEVDAANRLVCSNYIECGLWDDDAPFRNNKHIHSPRRSTFVAIDGNKILATASIIRDSSEGLPIDEFQPAIMATLRRNGDRIAEVSAVAVDKTAKEQRNLILFLFKFVIQYSFYYAEIDRFVAAVVPKHAVFYESIIRFQAVGSPDRHGYVNQTVAQFLTLHLLEAHKRLCEHYELDAMNRQNFYRFFLVDEHPNLRFPDANFMRRSRHIDWVAHARLGDLRVAI